MTLRSSEKREKLLKHTTMWVDFKYVTLRERSQTQKATDWHALRRKMLEPSRGKGVLFISVRGPVIPLDRGWSCNRIFQSFFLKPCPIPRQS